MSVLVQARGIRMAFGGIEVVKGVDLDLSRGEVHAIVGENGAGKSTVAKILAGVHRPTAGQISLEGAPLELQGPRDAIERGIALIHQEPLTFPDLDVTENIFAGHQKLTAARFVDRRAMRAKAKEILTGLGVALNPAQKVRGLSVADQQMVELASALSRDAQVLLMDETTAALTPKEVAELFVIVRRLRSEGRAFAFVSHHLEEVFEIADRITVMRDGEKVAELRPSETSIREVVRLMVGRDLQQELESEVHATSAAEKVRLSVRDLSRAGIFSGVSFELCAGEILGLGGLVGAGRTDVCRAIFGVAPPTSGQIEIDGRPVKIAHPRDAMKLGIALVPEDRQHEGLFMPMSIGQNGSLAAIRRLSKRGWLQDAQETSAVQDLLGQLHTAYRSVTQPVKELSGGNQQKVALAKWLLTEPSIILLDEPTRGVDVGAKAEVHRLIRDLAGRGMAVLIVSSDLPELLALSDRVLVMNQGRPAGILDRAHATPEAVMLAATGQGAT